MKQTSVAVYETGLSGNEQMEIILKTILEKDGVAHMPDIYAAIETRLQKYGLSLPDKGAIRDIENIQKITY